ncbi:MAG: DUF4838 domain-containing protein [Candidatus Hydrogenedentes bacterium]|nr:DUF4838 domain-containing protein [Candidatus Hydrogenedentota bacterium]
MKIIVAISVFLFATVAGMAADIAPADMQDWGIVVASDAIPSERYAAEEFQALYQQITGKSLSIAAAPPAGGHAIYIGPGAAAQAPSIAFDATGMGEEALRIRLDGENLVIAGGRSRGTLYGVYEFFERYCGVRFLTADHTHFPALESVPPIAPLDFTYNPPFSFRWSYYKANADHPQFAARLHVNTVTPEEKLGGITRQTLIGHSYARWITPEKYGKTHPEYFALIDGERKCNIPAQSTEPCVTNPEVLDIITQSVLEEIAANPTMENITVSQNDNDGYCRCPECAAINEREGTPMGANLALVNAVAERVEKAYPNVKVGTLAYWYTRKAPKTIKPRHNVQIQLCSIECCELHPINDPNCPKNVSFCQDVMDWKAISDNVWIWNYNTNFSYYDLPFPNLRVIGPNVRFFRDNNAKGVFMQANAMGDAGDMCDLRNYLMARTLWNPELESWPLVEEFCNLHYENAAPVILEYLKLVHDNAEVHGIHPNCGASPVELGLTPEGVEKGFDLFQQALALAPNDTVRTRVEMASIPTYRAMIVANGRPWRNVGGVVTRDLPERFASVIPHYIALCKKYNMSYVAESKVSSDYFEQLEKMAAMPAVGIENAVWRMTILPEQNGKMVELFHKPSRRYMLQGITHDNILQGCLDEVGQAGFASNAFSPFVAHVDGNVIHLTRSLEDGSAVERSVGFKQDEPEAIVCTSRVTHRGSDPKLYQFRTRSEFNAFSNTADDKVLAVYAKGDAWVQFNKDWKESTGPGNDILVGAKGGGFAYFNHEAKSGMAVTYDPACVKYPRLRWYPQHEQVNLELFSQDIELKQGEKLEMDYTLRFLAEAPR